MWSSTGATIGIVSKLMDVHAPLSRGVIALDVVGDCGWGRLVGLLESYGSADIGVSTDDGD